MLSTWWYQTPYQAFIITMIVRSIQQCVVLSVDKKRVFGEQCQLLYINLYNFRKSYTGYAYCQRTRDNIAWNISQYTLHVGVCTSSTCHVAIVPVMASMVHMQHSSQVQWVLVVYRVLHTLELVSVVQWSCCSHCTGPSSWQRC